MHKGFNRLLDRIYFNVAGTGGWMPALKQALLVIKAKRLCFGSDYPWEMARSPDLKSYINAINRLDLPDRDKSLILGGNMKRLSGIRETPQTA